MTREEGRLVVEHVERADAARNRRKILDAAAAILAEGGASALSLDEVARTANVGVGTVYRRFHDRAGLMFALLEDRLRLFQDAFTEGEPPLGPGAPAHERVSAFLHALVDLVHSHLELVLLAETSSPTARYKSGPYRLHHAHLAELIGELHPDAAADYLADALLAPVASTLVSFQCGERGMDVDEIKSGIDVLVGCVTRG